MAHISGHYGHFIADLETAEAAMASGGTGGEAPTVKTEAEVARGRPTRDSEDEMTDGEEVPREVPRFPRPVQLLTARPHHHCKEDAKPAICSTLHCKKTT